MIMMMMKAILFELPDSAIFMRDSDVDSLADVLIRDSDKFKYTQPENIVIKIMPAKILNIEAFLFLSLPLPLPIY